MANQLSGKRVLINSANSAVVIAAGIAAFILVFSLVACKALFSQSAYQNRVISKEHKTLNQLKSNLTAANQLDTSYKAFTDTSQNVLGGSPTGTGSQDGDNAKIVLDALPSTYDFPALVNSLHQLVAPLGVTVNSITGTDDEVAQSQNKTSATPTPVAMPFTMNVSGNYTSIQAVIAAFELSIRPIQVQSLTVGGSQDKLTLDIKAQTYYQPAKTLTITKESVK